MKKKLKILSFLTEVNVVFAPELGTFRPDYRFLKVQHKESTNSP